jgi:hypothetical protein
MQHIQGISRQQLQIISLEDKITQDNPVRFIEAFVENISLEASRAFYGLQVKENT